jgi:phosphoglycolate phosphatase
MASAGARGLIGVAFGIQPDDADFEAMRTEFLANYEAQIAEQTVLFEDVVALLAKIESNDQHWGIVTNKPLRYTDVLLPLIGLAHAACSISGDTTPHAKPHPEPLFEAARRLQLAPDQCWYVGDDLRDIQAGKAAGMPTIAAGWGYCGMSEPTNWDADFIAGSPREIIELLSGT